MRKFIFSGWIISILALFFYSFTQVDLNLTLSRVPEVSQIIKNFQYLGYFQRPLSTLVFLIILFLLFTFYFLLLYLAKNNRISKKEFWFLLIATSLILLFSYPAFSYDIYNYMFDAKTIVVYHQNPLQVRPLDFPSDPWLLFMRWTHRPSVYPPIWIGLTLPFYLLGFNIFILQLLSFKFIMSASFILSVFLLEKILKKITKKPLPFLVFYAFSPILIIENLVSGHNDIVMMAISLLSLWMLFSGKKTLSIVTGIVSILIKYMTVVFLPMILVRIFWKKNLSEVLFFRTCLLLICLAFVYLLTKIEIQPWYLIWLMPFIVLANWKFLWPLTIGFSLGLLLRYAPYLYFGNWDYPVGEIKFYVTVALLIVSGLVSVYFYTKKHPKYHF